MTSIPWIGPKPTLVKPTESTISSQIASLQPLAAVATAVSTIGDDYSRFRQSGILGFEFRLAHQNLLPVRGLN
ncbi:hypothetical protein AKJ16_DCAP23598 [Drosera capensis]